MYDSCLIFCKGHLLKNIDEGKALHRAFSVFIFNSNDELLIQQRSENKIIFPGYWANSCCSHPLHNLIEEVDELNNAGVKRAAIRKLNHELGIRTSDLDIDELLHMTRILYKSPCDNLWGEHEVDHLIILRGDFELNLNENEVQNTINLKKNDLRSFIMDGDNGKHNISPWFKFISSTFLPIWWENLNSLNDMRDSKIHKFY